MAKASLAVDRMSDRQLWEALEKRCYWLEAPSMSVADVKRKKALPREMLQITRELRLRGVQLVLEGLTSGRR